MQSVKKDSPQETVLLRHAQPKYGFQEKKLKKKPRKTPTPAVTGTTQPVTQQTQSPTASDPRKQTSQQIYPASIKPTSPPALNQVTAALPKPTSQQVYSVSHQSAFPQASTPLTTGLPKPRATQSAQPFPVPGTQKSDSYHYADHNSRTKTASIVKPLSATGVSGPLQTSVNVSQTIQLPQKPIQIISPVQGAVTSDASSGHVALSSTLPSPSAAIKKLEEELGLVHSGQEEATALRKENERLKQELDVQIKVNSELKKLLVASVGEDLERRVERLARDKAELSHEVGGYNKKVTEDYENLDKVSIQADMWRSKFLASRVMIDELASARAFFALQYQESQGALQQLLTERHELRANLLEMFKCLQQVKGAFDPLNAHKSVTLPSTNVIDLARNSQQLAEAIRYRLLPGQLNMSTVLDIDDQLGNCLTQAERFAEELVARQTSLDPVQKSVSGNLFGPSGTVVERYHPDARFDNLTMNCCAQCKGDISVL